MKRHGQGIASLSFYNLLIAGLLSPCAASAIAKSIPAWHVARSSRLQLRDQGEHVVLADCRNSSGVVSSQMAYFNGTPNNSPQDIAVVATPYDQTRLWANANTTGLFTDTGTNFTAVLGPEAAPGQYVYAGTGNNGYGNFTCWQNYVANLYTYGGTTCSEVYDCNHDPPPSPTSSPNGNVGALSTGALIAIIVGVVVGVVIAVVAFVFAYIVRRRTRRGEPRRSGCCGLFGAKPKAAPPPSPSHDDSIKAVTDGLYELDGQYHGVEMHADWRAEMAAVDKPTELDVKEEPAMLESPTQEKPHILEEPEKKKDLEKQKDSKKDLEKQKDSKKDLEKQKDSKKDLEKQKDSKKQNEPKQTKGTRTEKLYSWLS